MIKKFLVKRFQRTASGKHGRYKIKSFSDYVKTENIPSLTFIIRVTLNEYDIIFTT